MPLNVKVKYRNLDIGNFSLTLSIISQFWFEFGIFANSEDLFSHDVVKSLSVVHFCPK